MPALHPHACSVIVSLLKPVCWEESLFCVFLTCVTEWAVLRCVCMYRCWFVWTHTCSVCYTLNLCYHLVINCNLKTFVVTVKIELLTTDEEVTLSCPSCFSFRLTLYRNSKCLQYFATRWEQSFYFVSVYWNSNIMFMQFSFAPSLLARFAEEKFDYISVSSE